MNRLKINSFDLDGVISVGLHPGPNDVIITGRSFQEAKETYAFLHSRGIFNCVFFNPLQFDEKTRESSGIHKAKIINMLWVDGVEIVTHFEDDEIQIQQILKHLHHAVNIVHVVHNLTDKENARHDQFGNTVCEKPESR